MDNHRWKASDLKEFMKNFNQQQTCSMFCSLVLFYGYCTVLYTLPIFSLYYPTCPCPVSCYLTRPIKHQQQQKKKERRENEKKLTRQYNTLFFSFLVWIYDRVLMLTALRNQKII